MPDHYDVLLYPNDFPAFSEDAPPFEAWPTVTLFMPQKDLFFNGEPIEILSQARARVVLGEHPRRGLLHVAVEAPDLLPDHVERVADATDRRRTLARLTDEGSATVEKATDAVTAIDFAVAGLTPRQQVDTYDLLRRLRRASGDFPD